MSSREGTPEPCRIFPSKNKAASKRTNVIYVRLHFSDQKCKAGSLHVPAEPLSSRRSCRNWEQFLKLLERRQNIFLVAYVCGVCARSHMYGWTCVGMSVKPQR